ncbi:MAG: aminotransferase class I/II-fold pyridoxal phosphate-dependent enzyme [Coprococcus sp.]|nr:aminotransferase class I/II-fold pyridoxal phosphate-dependent enzyme [Coprococcus sp.]
MQHFECDYLEGCHPQILKKLAEINMEKNPGYGSDPYCRRAVEKIRLACKTPNAEIYFLTGGTQTNAAVISALLKTYQGVISAETGHVNVHEAGAIEACGHKVIALPHTDGKLLPDTLEQYLISFYADETYPHMVQPGMVYLSYPTENGTLYTKDELCRLHTICRSYHLPIFIDGARLGYGLCAETTDVALHDIAAYADAFYIGGTKLGALFGEAVVFTDPSLAPCFFTHIKQHGALLAKGWLIGMQYDVLFTDELYFKGARHAVHMAMKLKKALTEKGYEFAWDSCTNQQFVILDNEKYQTLKEKVTFSVWEKKDETHIVVRFATSWATKESDVDTLISFF